MLTGPEITEILKEQFKSLSPSSKSEFVNAAKRHNAQLKQESSHDEDEDEYNGKSDEENSDEMGQLLENEQTDGEQRSSRLRHKRNRIEEDNVDKEKEDEKTYSAEEDLESIIFRHEQEEEEEEEEEEPLHRKRSRPTYLESFEENDKVNARGK
jgi:hypothetical protein